MMTLLYRKSDTFVHRLDPRVKLFSLVILFAICMLFEDHLLLLTVLGCVLALCEIGRSLPQLLALKVPMILITVFTVLLWSVFYRFTPEGIHYAIAMAIRLNIFVAGGVLYLSTTRLEDFTLALILLRVPYQVSFSISLAFRLFPAFVGTAQVIAQAQRARGLDLNTKNPVRFVRNHLPLLVPIFICALRQADILSMALETRGFGATGHPRTHYQSLAMGKRDWGALGVMLAAAALLLAVKWINGWSEPGI